MSRVARPIRLGIVLLLGAGGLAVAAWLALHLVPLPAALSEPPRTSPDILDRHGRRLRQAREDASSFARPVDFSAIPPALTAATIAAEDRRFWGHAGVDPAAALRASWDLIRCRRVVSGASTITMQLIKQTRPGPRTFSAKLKESVLALRLEQVWDKQRILAEYLNRIDYGRLNLGCAQAADFYFAKPLAELSAAECALLAGLPQAPSRLDPHRHADRARRRQLWILDQMRREGFLTSAEWERARSEPLRLAPAQRAFEAPHFVDLLLQTLPQKTTGPLRSSLDLPLNRVVEQALRDQLAHLRDRRVRSGAAVVLDNPSGQVLALVGSGDFFSRDGGQVNAALSPRSAGSTFKPFTYLLAFEQGASPATLGADVPTEYATATGLFAPLNYDRRFRGPVRYREALANSLNVPAVRALASVGGPEPLLRRLRALGLTTLTNTAEHYGLGLTLGNAEARLLELANAYATLARLGAHRPVSLLLNRTPATPFVQVAPVDAAWLVADVLSDNHARAAAFGLDSSLRFEFPVACKTGTSSDFRDNWAFAYTPEFTVGVWMGNPDGSPMERVSGVSGAAPLLHEIVNHLHERFGTTWFERPASVAEAWIHPLTGKRISDERLAASRPSDPRVIEKFLRRFPPAEATADDFDAQGRARLPSEFADWLASSSGKWLAPKAVCESASRELRILSPLPGSTYFLDPDLPEGGSRLALRAQGSGPLHWHCETLPCCPAGDRTVAVLKEGRHRLTVTNGKTGRPAETWIVVKSL